MTCPHCGAVVYWDRTRRRMRNLDSIGGTHLCDYVLGQPIADVLITPKESAYVAATPPPEPSLPAPVPRVQVYDLD